MPSRSSSACIVGALLTAIGLAAQLAGSTIHTTEQAAALVTLAVGAAVTTAAAIMIQRKTRQSEYNREAIAQARAFGAAIEVIRQGSGSRGPSAD